MITEAENQCLRMIAEMLAEKVETARVFRVGVYADDDGDIVVLPDIQIVDGHVADAFVVKKAPSCVTRHVFKKPNCVERIDHHSGVSLPRRPPQSQGHVQMPSRLPLMETEISLFHGSRYIGASEQASKENSSQSKATAFISKCPKRYSSEP